MRRTAPRRRPGRTHSATRNRRAAARGVAASIYKLTQTTECPLDYRTFQSIARERTDVALAGRAPWTYRRLAIDVVHVQCVLLVRAEHGRDAQSSKLLDKAARKKALAVQRDEAATVDRSSLPPGRRSCVAPADQVGVPSQGSARDEVPAHPHEQRERELSTEPSLHAASPGGLPTHGSF